MRLYRAVSPDEFDELMKRGVFRCIPGSIEGKWFAEAAEHATAWGLRFTRLTGIHHDKIVEAEIDDAVADQLFRLPMLDGIGPARFATLDQLRGCQVQEAKIP